MKTYIINQVIATNIRNSEVYSEAVLGMSKEAYIRTITGTRSWGGAIELAIFAEHFQTEIVSIDVETCRPYFFGICVPIFEIMLKINIIFISRYN
jgi:ubiquitin thioesterase OTU1